MFLSALIICLCIWVYVCHGANWETAFRSWLSPWTMWGSCAFWQVSLLTEPSSPLLLFCRGVVDNRVLIYIPGWPKTSYVKSKLVLNLQGSICLCLPNAGVIAMYHRGQPVCQFSNDFLRLEWQCGHWKDGLVVKSCATHEVLFGFQ